MTNHWVDLKNADYILVCGSNCAENHPASMTWIHKAMDDRGAKLIVVDPRFTRTASNADVYAPIRSGTDIAFYGGMMNYIIENNLHHKEYVATYTNAATLINPEFKGPIDLDGFFSGYDSAARKYDRSTWTYQTDDAGAPVRDESLQNPNCAFQHLKRHYSRYDLNTVSTITGCPVDKLELVYKTYAQSGNPAKTGTILYAMGQTQHTVGSQNVRCMAMVQLLLGNVGRPGGGVNALRGESNVQGSTDMAILAHIIPAYMATPSAGNHPTFQDYLDKETPKSGYWSNKPKFFVSLLKAWWGENARYSNGFAYDNMPKVESASNHYWISLFESMQAGTIKGCWVMGMNPAVSGPNARFEREALKKLDWLVVQELFDTETVNFWKAPGENPANIQTEVFILPAADAMEKEGSIVTSGRLIQWRPKVAEPPGVALPDDQILNLIGLKLKYLYNEDPGPFSDPIDQLTWDYGVELDIEKVAAEINGYYTQDTEEGRKGDIVVNFTKLKDDGSTACGNWLYSGYWYPADDGEGNVMPATKRRGQQDPGGLGMYPYWAFTWPVNRRIIYNRCSADLNGKPWAEDKALIWWNGEKWTGYDVPDFAGTKAPDAPGGRDPFIMKTDGKGWLWGALNEGPLPEHYEPVESPLDRNPMSSQMNNPVIKVWRTNEGQDIGDSIGSPGQFPIVATTYRVCEHWQAGAMSRWLEWLTECHPDMFLELSKELAAEKGIENGDMVKVRSARAEIEAVAIVTARFKPFKVDGKLVHQVGMPWHFGWGGLATGDSANDLTPHVGDGNTTIPEYKAFLVDVEKA